MGDTNSGLERGLTRVKGFDSAEMDFQLIRQLGATRYGGASVGECLALAREIEDAVPASWVAAFSAAAVRTEKDAKARASRGHAWSARDQYMVASNSYRAAEYYTSVTDPRHSEYGLKSRECFLAAMRLSGQHCDEVWLPFDGMKLPAYYLRPSDAADTPGKTLMIISGFDGTLEETYMAYGLPALERGYNVFIFAGPGQMDSMRFHPEQPFIPEFEKIGRVAIDHVLDRPHTDPKRVALMGISYGGYFAIRIAANDARVKALIPNSPILDLHSYMTSFAGLDAAEMPDENDFRLADLEHIPDEVMPPQLREMAGNLMRRMGRDSFKQTYIRLREYRVSESDLKRIVCPALALVGAGEGEEPIAQAKRFRAGVGGPVAAHIFTPEEGADGHCQTANLAYSAAVSMDWLDETFA